ncbi:MAG: class I SAM-dependent rRNA methyltransferase [Kiritimatiellae bacterium]|nr:class I SAM-dependent rRNA methyltransferase [Kiritimatiellia bacterium]
MEKVLLKKGRERSVLRRHPWIFSGAIEGPVPEGVASGGTVEVCAADGAVLGFGSYSPASQIRVRMLSYGADRAPDAAFVKERVFASVGRRGDFFVNAYTDAMRLVNAESDGLPGVVADYYAGWVVCQFTSAGAEFWKDAVADALMSAAPGCLGVSERLDIDVRAKEGLPREPAFRVLRGAEPPELVEIAEGPCKFLIDVRKGHKTGFYLDQRDARAAVGPLANGADVLNCFSYTGGFGLFARACGAASVVQVDVSADALALARRNEEIQHMCGTRMEYVEADVFKYLRSCRDAGRTFDMIVLDPPKFAETKAQVMKAARGYKDINLLAMKLLRPGGTLATFSCSGAMTPELFDKILAEASEDAGRSFQVVARTRQGADHPVALSFPEGHYLKGVVLREFS